MCRRRSWTLKWREMHLVVRLDQNVGETAEKTWKTPTYSESILWIPHFLYTLENVGDTESKWVRFRVLVRAIVEATSKSCGQKVAGSCLGCSHRTCWWTSVVKEANRLQAEEAIQVWLAKLSHKKAEKNYQTRRVATLESLMQNFGWGRSSGRA